jgi:hypothetical protein
MPGPGTRVALGDCASVSDIPTAQRSRDAVFVGDVTRTENDGRWAVVLVAERWQNASGLPDTVTVHGGPEPGTITSADRAFTVGRWLFDATNFGPYLIDSSCSASQPWTDDLAQYRPTGVAEASGSGSSSGDLFGSTDIVVIAILVGALLIAVLAYILILRRRRRPPEWMR